MPYKRYPRCPLLTSHGRILTLLQEKEALRRPDIAEALHLADSYIGRLLGELSGEGLIVHERLPSGAWWVLAPGYNLLDRFMGDSA